MVFKNFETIVCFVHSYVSRKRPSRISYRNSAMCPSQWPRGLMYSPTQTLGSWVRIPLGAWMSALIRYLCCPMKVAALRWADHTSKESSQLSIRFMISELILNRNRPENFIRHRGRRRRRWSVLCVFFNPSSRVVLFGVAFGVKHKRRELHWVSAQGTSFSEPYVSLCHIFRNITKIDGMLETPALETRTLASAQQWTRIFVFRQTNELTGQPVPNIRGMFSWRFVRINS
jgi:hypothetical protein